MIKIVAAANAMKGSLSSVQAAASIARGVEDAFKIFSQNTGKNLTFSVIQKPVADGGDDTLDAIAEKFYKTPVIGPFGSPIEAKWGSLGQTAIIEMAKASGIALVPPSQLNPFVANTYGTGQLISKAIDEGFKDILLTIGGSATVDGGIGAISALGVQFYDKNGKSLKAFGNSAAGQIFNMDLTKILNKCKGVNISIACDVNNPLLGPSGASAIFGPQKIAPQNHVPKEKLERLVSELENNLKHLSEVMKKCTGKDVANMPGCGAAGGFPLSFCSILNSKVERGSKLVLDILNFNKLIDSDIVITCEGRCDIQTLHGKGPYEVCNVMKKSHVIMLCGGIESKEAEEGMLKAGANVVSSIVDGPNSLETCIHKTDELLQRASFRHVYSYLTTKYT
ncbi:Glycerate kinase [Tritrichomonas foetus]|uniref:Glycerate kinase n=1 Tax=Tritrichomonas foetus TaxID=1144522 RepID=A0A1J4KR39_9EUKA|nr:Glycerate kinase [Tritrichomonas foetus]|eukprot:OHT13753.1 Glycerate kinase [Tritrichomonas foetus]